MSPAKILVVDDEIELQQLIEQRFRKQIQAQTLSFTYASNGIEALHKLQQDDHIDMVITDINMPEMDGLTFIHYLPKINETLKAVVISAYDDMTRIRQAMNEGAFDFVTKPIDFQDLERTIQKTLKFVNQLKDKQLQTQKFQEQLRYAAFNDSLTGLPNRAWLFNHLKYLFKQREQPHEKFVALFFIDLDNFKQLNDSRGHLIGDKLLKCVAERLASCLREGDFLARLGGDEFVIVLEGISDITVAVMLAERIKKQLVTLTSSGDDFSEISASIGIALGTKKYQEPEEFLQEADAAMYAAKSQGKGCYVIHNDGVDSEKS